MKLYQFTAFSKESEDFELKIIAHENILFSELHQAIQSSLNYDPLQMASFFISDEDWNKEKEIALLEMDENSETLLMDEVKVSDLLENQKLIYLFDFFSERVFYLNVDEIKDTDSKEFSINVSGLVPVQIKIDSDGIDDLLGNIDIKKDSSEYDDDFDDDYNDDISFENIDDIENF